MYLALEPMPLEPTQLEHLSGNVVIGCLELLLPNAMGFGAFGSRSRKLPPSQ